VTRGTETKDEEDTMATYKAVEVAAPGSLRIVEKPIPEPGDSRRVAG